MYHFDEDKINIELSSLTSSQRAAFAAACAQRISPAFRIFTIDTQPMQSENVNIVLDFIWKTLSCQSITFSVKEMEALLADFIQEEDEDDDYTIQKGAADDAAAATYYTLSCLQSGRAQDAVWSARRIHDALDEYISNQLDSKSYDEIAIESHMLMQRELELQHDDLIVLRNSSDCIQIVREKSLVNSSKTLPWATFGQTP